MMRAAIGDRMVVAAAHVDGPVRDGEIVSTGADGAPPYRIRWSDTCAQLFFPGSDARVEHFTQEGDAGQPAGAYRAHTKSWRIDVYLFEEDGVTSAQAVLHGDAASPVTGRGQARRRPGDPDVPEIGDEVAVSRVLGRLAELLLRTASDDLSEVSGHAVALPR